MLDRNTDPDPLERLIPDGVLSWTFQLYGKLFGTLVAISFVTMAPVVVAQTIMQFRLVTLAGADDATMLAAGCLYPLAVMLLSLVAQSITAGASVFAVGHHILGQDPGARRSLAFALSRFGALLEVNVGIAIRVFLGLLLLIVPGIVWAVAYSIAIPTLVTEGVRSRKALQRSWFLAKGRKWKFFGVLFVIVGMINGGLVLLVTIATAVAFDLQAPSGLLMQQLVVGVLSILLTPLYLIAVTLLYYDARVRAEDFDAEQLSRAFSVTSPPRPRQPATRQELVATPLSGGSWRSVRAPQQAIECGDYAARMSWRSVTYILGERAIHFVIEPMSTGPDVVYVPDEAGWQRTTPEWAKSHRAAVLACLRAMRWNRALEWREGSGHGVWRSAAGETRIVRGSLEASTGGQILEGQSLFHPGQSATPEEVREVWHDALRRYVAQATGRMTIDKSRVVPGSTFEDVALPLLRNNRNVELDLRDVATREAEHPPRPVAPAPPARAAAVGSPAPAAAAGPPPGSRPDKLTASDLFIELDDAARSSVLASWRWLVGESAQAFRVTVFGDVFATTPGGHVHWLDTGRGTWSQVAESLQGWQQSLPAHAARWFHVELLRELHAMNMRLASGQVYSWLDPPVLGGEVAVENVYAVPVASHVQAMAAAARQRY
ncbi:MAG: hypothetical protein GY719_03635 [bacterium]|nr:hypothetical protein [bacterium]